MSTHRCSAWLGVLAYIGLNAAAMAGAPPAACLTPDNVTWNEVTKQYIASDGTYRDSGLANQDPQKPTVAIIGASVDLQLGDALVDANPDYNFVVAYCGDLDAWTYAAEWAFTNSPQPIDYVMIGMHAHIFADGQSTEIVGDLTSTTEAVSEYVRWTHGITRDNQLIMLYPEWGVDTGDEPKNQLLEERALMYGNYFRGLADRKTEAPWTPYVTYDGLHANTATIARAMDRVIYHLNNIQYPMPWGSYWNFGAYDFSPWNDNGYNLMRAPRFANDICNQPGVNDTPATCRLDTRAIVQWGGVWYEMITANGRYWNYNVDAGYTLVASGDLRSIARYAAGPCNGQPDPCTLDSLGMVTTDKTYEIITANGKYYNYAPLESDQPLATGWMYEIPRWGAATGPCYLKGQGCRFDAYDIWADSGNVYEVVIAYGNWYKFNVSTGQRLEYGNLLDVPHFKSGPCVGQTGTCSFDTLDLAFDLVQSITVSP